MRVAFIALTFFISVDVSRSFFLCFDDDLRASDDTVYNDIRVFFSGEGGHKHAHCISFTALGGTVH